MCKARKYLKTEETRDEIGVLSNAAVIASWAPHGAGTHNTNECMNIIKEVGLQFAH